MAAQNQSDEPHVPSDNWRNSPATASTSSPEYTPDMASSDIDMDISSPPSISESEALALKSSLMSSHPSSSSSPLQSTNATQEISSLEGIEMPSNTLSFAASSSGLSDMPRMQVVTFEDITHIISLEREICQNYNCCGVPLADFHALMSHFDRAHVSVVAPGGKRIFPPVRPPSPPSSSNQLSPPSPSSSSTTSTPSPSSRSSSVESSPPPETPVTPASLTLGPVTLPVPDLSMEYDSYPGLALSFGSTESLPNDPCPYSNEVLSAFGPVYDFTKDYACYEWAYSEKLRRKSLEEQRERESQQRAADRLDSEVHTPTETPLATSVEQDQGDNAARSSLPLSQSLSTSNPDSPSEHLPGGWRTGPTLSKKSKSRENSSITNNGGKVSKPKAKLTSSSGATCPVSSMGRKREKNFKCPRQGCTKSYLNPNGLKYHLEKGTCKFDGPESDTSGSTSSDSSASSPIESQPSVIASAASISLPPSTPPSDSSAESPPPSLQHPLMPSTSYSCFPATMSPSEVYQAVMQAALLSTPVQVPKEQGFIQARSTPAVAAIIIPERVQSASAPVSDEVLPEVGVDASAPTTVPALRPSATTYGGRLGQGQAAFNGSASSSL